MELQRLGGKKVGGRVLATWLEYGQANVSSFAYKANDDIHPSENIIIVRLRMHVSNSLRCPVLKFGRLFPSRRLSALHGMAYNSGLATCQQTAL